MINKILLVTIILLFSGVAGASTVPETPFNKVYTVIDFSKPSNEKRLTIYNSQGKEIFKTYVAHGKNSGDLYATQFSNKIGSHKSSVGKFITLNTYYGKRGYSLRIKGLDKNVNDNAFKRAIVIHTAPYAQMSYIQKHGKMGRSLGCFVLTPQVSKYVIDIIKNGTIINVIGG